MAATTPGLITKDVIHVKSDFGACKIELCVGDITKLRREDKVDVLVLSAFPGDYSPTPSSLIGQLIQLGISVKNLSKDKEEDLRKQYYCWWSKPLPDHLSYGRILCFEGTFGLNARSPPMVIGAIFRCLVPILKNKEGSVIMPLITTGDQVTMETITSRRCNDDFELCVLFQGFSKALVLSQIVKAAVNWIKTGLPLRNLKIVIFSRVPEKEHKEFIPLFESFKEYKNEVENKDLVEESEKEEGVHLYDIYLSHCTKDRDTSLEVKQYFQHKYDVKVFDDIQDLDKTKSWQDDIYNVMVRCSRVVTLLSPNYLSSESCVEQYNMALCISRRKHKEVLAPFYVQSVEYLPTYMGLMQYVDCRPNDLVKIQNAADSVHSWLKDNKIALIQDTQTAIVERPVLSFQQHYDVFISYSHRNDKQARHVYKTLKIFNPNLNIFIDTAGLKTGTSWQQSLFHALDNSTMVVAILSEDYFKSKVCKEEYSLAIALHLDPEKEFKLVAILIQQVESIPEWCSKPRPVYCAPEDDKMISTVARGVVNTLRVGIYAVGIYNETLSSNPQDHPKIEECMLKYRKNQFLMRHELLQIDNLNDPQEEKPNSNTLTTQRSSCLVALSFATEDAQAATILKSLLEDNLPGITVSEPRTNATSRLKALDDAEVIIILLSSEYFKSKELIEELNIALYRNRCSTYKVVYPIQVSVLPIKPTYMHLLPCENSSLDYSWQHMALDHKILVKIDDVMLGNDIEPGLAACLVQASDLVVKRLTNPGKLEENCDVLVNFLDVLETWAKMRVKLEKENGLLELKNAFNVKSQNQTTAKDNGFPENTKPREITRGHERKSGNDSKPDDLASDSNNEISCPSTPRRDMKISNEGNDLSGEQKEAKCNSSYKSKKVIKSRHCIVQ